MIKYALGVFSNKAQCETIIQGINMTCDGEIIRFESHNHTFFNLRRLIVLVRSSSSAFTQGTENEVRWILHERLEILGRTAPDERAGLNGQ